jgi:hypothetical protein
MTPFDKPKAQPVPMVFTKQAPFYIFRGGFYNLGGGLLAFEWALGYFIARSTLPIQDPLPS